MLLVGWGGGVQVPSLALRDTSGKVGPPQPGKGNTEGWPILMTTSALGLLG